MARFKKGESGNPSGRPVGSTCSSTRLRQAIGEAMPDVIDGLILAAKAGDTGAAKLLLDRALPALRPVDTPVPLALGDDTTDLAGASQAVLRGLAQGALSVDQAHGLAGVLGALVKVREATELEARITRLEESANARNP